MAKPLNKLVVALVRPPLIALGFVMKPVVRFLFGNVARRIATRNQNRLTQNVEEELPFLFNKYGARFIPNEGVPFPPGSDYAIVTVELGDLFFRFIRGRGALDIYVASRNAPQEWHDVLLVIRAMEDPGDMRYTSFIFLRDAAVVLKKKISLIQTAFSSARFSDTSEHLAKHYKYTKAVTKQLQNEINRRLYS